MQCPRSTEARMAAVLLPFKTKGKGLGLCHPLFALPPSFHTTHTGSFAIPLSQSRDAGRLRHICSSALLVVCPQIKKIQVYRKVYLSLKTPFTVYFLQAAAFPDLPRPTVHGCTCVRQHPELPPSGGKHHTACTPRVSTSLATCVQPSSLGTLMIPSPLPLLPYLVLS